MGQLLMCIETSYENLLYIILNEASLGDETILTTY